MIRDLKELLVFLEKHNLTLKEFITCFLIYKEDTISTYRFFKNDGGMGKESYDKLIGGKWLKHNKYKSNIDIDNYEIDEKFIKLIKQTSDEALVVWEEYPSYMYINGNRVPAKTMDKEEYLTLFIDRHLGRPSTIEQIKKAIQIMKDEEINLGIEKFIKSEQWKPIIEQYNEY